MLKKKTRIISLFNDARSSKIDHLSAPSIKSLLLWEISNIDSLELLKLFIADDLFKNYNRED